MKHMKGDKKRGGEWMQRRMDELMVTLVMLLVVVLVMVVLVVC